jgi:phosphatidylglycerophosphatase A
VSWVVLFVREYGEHTLLYGYFDNLTLFLYITLFCAIILTVYSGIAFLIANNKTIASVGIARLIAVFFGFGLFPGMPGTAGTLGAVMLYYCVHDSPLYSTILFTILIVGVWSAEYVSSTKKEADPKEVVIDEVAGFFITMFLIPFSWINILCGFILFRFFDIVKPGPVRYVEKAPGGYGIMLDDIVAGIFANILLQLLYHNVLINL